MAYDLSPQQTQSLYDGGHIGDDLYNRLMQGVPSTDNPITPMPLAPDYTPQPSAPAPSWLDSLKSLQIPSFGPHDVANDLGVATSQEITPDAPSMAGMPPVVDPHAIPAVAPSRGAPKLAANIQAPIAPSPLSGPSPYDAGFDKQINALADLTTAQNDKTNAQAEDINGYLKTTNKINEDAQKNEIFRQQKQNDAMSQLNDATNAVNAMKIDPDHFWQNSSTGQKVGLGISLFLGAFGGAQNGGENKVVGIINDAINRDIKAQQINISNAQSGVNAKANVLSHMRAQFGDERAAEAAAKVAALDKVDMQLKQRALLYSDPETQARAEMLHGELMNKKKEYQIQFLNAQANGGMNLTPSEKLAYRKDAGERSTPLGQVVDARIAPEVRTTKAAFDNMRLNLAQQKILADKYAGGVSGAFSIDDSNRAKALSADLRQSINKLNENGVMNPGDLEELQKMVPDDVTSSKSINSVKKLRTLNEIISNRYNTKMNAMGLKDPSASSHIITNDKARGK